MASPPASLRDSDPNQSRNDEQQPSADLTPTHMTVDQNSSLSSQGMGPTHSAIILSSEEDPEELLLFLEMERLRSTLTPSVMARLENFESQGQRVENSPTTRSASLSSLSTQPDDVQTMPLFVETPTTARTSRVPDSRSSNATRSPMRRSLTNSTLGYEENESDSSTFIGRRVAAILETGSLPDTPEPSPHPLSNSIVPNNSPPPQDIRRRIPLVTTGYRHERFLGNRSYLVRRRLDADGEEQIHTVRTPVDHGDGVIPAGPGVPGGQASSFRPGHPSAYAAYLRARADRYLARISQSSEGNPTTQTPAPRRRDWVRLGTEGNVASLEDEDGQTHDPNQSSTQSSTSSERRQLVRRSELVPATQTLLSQEPADGSTVRVRFNVFHEEQPNRSDALSHTVVDLEERSARSNSDEYWIGSSIPFYVNPLPLPLPDIAPQLRSLMLQGRARRFIRVSGRADLAGR